MAQKKNTPHHKVPDRVKGNAKTANKEHSFSTLISSHGKAFESRFNPFEYVGDQHEDSYSTINQSVDNLNICSEKNNELKSLLKLAFKKDFLTRSKALQSIINLYPASDNIAEFWDIILPSFTFLFLTMSEDPSYVIRTKPFELLKIMVSYEQSKLVRNNLALWKEIFPIWLLAMYEPEESVRRVSRAVFELCASFLSADGSDSTLEPDLSFPSPKSIKLMKKLVNLCQHSLVRIFSSVITELDDLCSKHIFLIEDSNLERNICSVLNVISLFQNNFSSYLNFHELFKKFSERKMISYLIDPRSSALLSKCFYSFACEYVELVVDIDLKAHFLLSTCKGILLSEKEGYPDSLLILNYWSTVQLDHSSMVESSNILSQWLASKKNNIISPYILPALPALFLAYCNDISWWFELINALNSISISSEFLQREVAFCLSGCQHSLLLLCQKGNFLEDEIESKILDPFILNLLSQKAICPGSVFMSSYLDSLLNTLTSSNRRLFDSMLSKIVEAVIYSGFLAENLDHTWLKSFAKYSISNFKLGSSSSNESNNAVYFLKPIYLDYLFGEHLEIGRRVFSHQFYGMLSEYVNCLTIESLFFKNVDVVEELLQSEIKKGSSDTDFRQLLSDYLLERFYCAEKNGVYDEIISRIDILSLAPETRLHSFALVVELGKRILSLGQNSFASPQSVWICSFPKSVLKTLLGPADILAFLNTIFDKSKTIYVPKYPSVLVDDVLFGSDIAVIQSFLENIFTFFEDLDLSQLVNSDKLALVKFGDYMVKKSISLHVVNFKAPTPYFITILYLQTVKYSIYFLQETLHSLLSLILYQYDDVNREAADLHLLKETISLLFDAFIRNASVVGYQPGYLDVLVAMKTFFFLIEDMSEKLFFLVFIFDKLTSYFVSDFIQPGIASELQMYGYSIDSFSYLHALFQICRSKKDTPPDYNIQSSPSCDIGAIAAIYSSTIDLLDSLDMDLSNHVLTFFKLDLVLFYCNFILNEKHRASFIIATNYNWNQIDLSLAILSSKFHSQGSIIEAFLNSNQVEHFESSTLWFILMSLRYLNSTYFPPLICSIVGSASLINDTTKRFLLLLTLGLRNPEQLSLTTCIDGRGSNPIPLSLWLFSIRRGCNSSTFGLECSDALSLLKFCQEQTNCTNANESTSEHLLKCIELISILHKAFFFIGKDPVLFLISDGIDWIKSEIISFYRPILNAITSTGLYSFLPIILDYLSLFLLSDDEFIIVAYKLFCYLIQILSDDAQSVDIGISTITFISKFFVSLEKSMRKQKSSFLISLCDKYFSSFIWNMLLDYCMNDDLSSFGLKSALLVLLSVLKAIRSFSFTEFVTISKQFSLKTIDVDEQKIVAQLKGHVIYYSTIVSFCIKEIQVYASLSSAMLDTLDVGGAFFRKILLTYHILFDGLKTVDTNNLFAVFDITSYDLGLFYLVSENCDQYVVPNEKATRLLYLYSLYCLFTSHPLKIRQLWLSLSSDAKSMDAILGDKNGSTLMSSFEKFISSYFSHLLIVKELEVLKNPSVLKRIAPMELTMLHSSSSSSIYVKQPLGEENAFLEMTLSFPTAYPLNSIGVLQTGKRVGISESIWRRWLLSTQVLLSGSTSQSPLTNTITSTSTILEALLLWKRNVEGRFAGLEECIICYSIFQPIDLSVPSKGCRTCKHKFHTACLVKWFKSSGNSTCPLCRAYI